MARLPWVKFFPTDWVGDMSLQQSSLEAQGAWIKILCLMWHDGVYTISKTMEDWSVFFGCDTSVTERVMDVIKNRKIADFTETGEIVTLLSRRLEREAKKKEANRLRQQKHRDNAKSNAPSNAPNNALRARARAEPLCSKDLSDDIGGVQGGKAETAEARLVREWSQIQADAGLPFEALPPLPAASRNPEAFAGLRDLTKWALNEYGGYDAVRARLLELCKAFKAGDEKLFSLRSTLRTPGLMLGKQGPRRANRTAEDYENEMPDWHK